MMCRYYQRHICGILTIHTCIQALRFPFHPWILDTESTILTLWLNRGHWHHKSACTKFCIAVTKQCPVKFLHSFLTGRNWLAVLGGATLSRLPFHRGKHLTHPMGQAVAGQLESTSHKQTKQLKFPVRKNWQWSPNKATMLSQCVCGKATQFSLGQILPEQWSQH